MSSTVSHRIVWIGLVAPVISSAARVMEYDALGAVAKEGLDLNGNGALEIAVTKLAGDTTLARVMQMVEEAQTQKAPTQRFIDKFSQWYTPAIIILSAAAYIISRDIELVIAAQACLLVLNWRQKSAARSVLKLAIEDTLDAGLPRAYTPEIYHQKCSAVFEHVYDCYPERDAGVYA